MFAILHFVCFCIIAVGDTTNAFTICARMGQWAHWIGWIAEEHGQWNGCKWRSGAIGTAMATWRRRDEVIAVKTVREETSKLMVFNRNGIGFYIKRVLRLIVRYALPQRMYGRFFMAAFPSIFDLVYISLTPVGRTHHHHLTSLDSVSPVFTKFIYAHCIFYSLFLYSPAAYRTQHTIPRSLTISSIWRFVESALLSFLPTFKMQWNAQGAARLLTRSLHK